MKRFSIYFFGDSICFGQYVSPNHIWVNKVAEQLEKELLPSGIELLVQNPSVNGNTTRMALERMPFDIQTKTIDLLVIQYGINDANLWRTDAGEPRVNIDSFRANLLEIIHRANAFGVKKVILNTNHPTGLIKPFDGKTFSHHDNNAKYNTVIRSIPNEFNEFVVLCDMEKQILDMKIQFNDYLLPDMIHLSKNGHKVYCDFFYKYCQKIVEEICLS